MSAAIHSISPFAMFFVLSLDKHLVVTPDYLGPNLYQHIVDVLMRTVEGSCSKRFGYIIKVLNMGDIGEGKVKDGGDVLFQVSYRAFSSFLKFSLFGFANSISSSARRSEKASEMYLRNTSPRTMCLYSAASRFSRRVFAVSQYLLSSSFDRPIT